MRALDLDHVRARSRAPWVRYALAAAALAFGLDQGYYYLALGNDVAALEGSLSRSLSEGARRLVPQQPARVPAMEEIAMARDTVGRLSTPWERLFRALEGAHTEQVSLLSIEPDAEARTVAIHGEAKDYLAALTYLAGLAEQPALRRVHLVRHELQRNGSQRPLAFTVSAGWQEAR